jgi:acyl-CoA thioesterase YciA
MMGGVYQKQQNTTMTNTTIENMELISTHPVKKSDLGFHGNLFGGKLLAWVDAAGAAYATQVCDTPRMVTVLIEECLFKKPAREGHLLKIYGCVNDIGITSVTLQLEARAHNVYSGNQSVILSTKIKFVRIDENNESIPITERVKNKYKID